MDGETTYVAGSGVLLGSGRHWLLIDTPADGPTLARWHAVAVGTGPVTDLLLRDLERHALGRQVSFALVDLTPGRERVEVRGLGSVVEDGGARVLEVGLPAATGPAFPFAGGIVAACTARVPAPPPDASPSGIIDGIPADILSPARASSAAPSSPAPPVAPSAAAPAVPVATPAQPPPAERTVVRAGPRATSADTDHDGHTVMRSDQGEHLRQPTHELVLAALCPAGHPTAPHSPRCRVCDAPVAPQQPRRVPRPVLGRLRLPTGETVTLDRGVVLGRKPSPVEGGEPWPHLVPLPGDSTYLSRNHLQIELDGWLVIARDLGSRGGTTLRTPHRQPERIRAHEPHVLEPGQRLDLADVYEILFEVDPS